MDKHNDYYERRDNFLLSVYYDHGKLLLSYSKKFTTEHKCILDHEDILFGFLYEHLARRWEHFEKEIAAKGAGYLMTSLKHYILSQQRKNVNRRFSSLPDDDYNGDTVEMELDIKLADTQQPPESGLCRNIRDIVGDRNYEILYRKFVWKHPAKVIGADVYLSDSGVGNVVQRSLAKLREELPKRGYAVRA